MIARVFVAPAFLYRAEPRREEDRRLTSWEIASRMSYFLWSTVPDSELRRAAGADELLEPTHRTAQVRRMLGDPKSARFATEFFGQWFGFYNFDSFRGIDGQQFPEFTPALKEDLYLESQSFFAHIVKHNRPVDEILFADYGFLTPDLAQHYGLEVGFADQAHSGNRPTLVHNVGSQRGGLLGLGTIHAITSAPLRTSAVKRGDWILRRVLGTPTPPPPADAGSIPADEVQADGKSIRERLETHRQDAVCASCHSRIDPLGFALENFDPIGRWRTEYRDAIPVDVRGELSDGAEIDGLAGLKQHLQRENQLFHRTLARRFIGYALGRGELLTDRALVRRMMALMSDGQGMFELAEAIVQSNQFLSRSD